MARTMWRSEDRTRSMHIMSVYHDCPISRAALDEYALGRLLEPDMIKLEEHLLFCSVCQRELQEIEELIAGLKVVTSFSTADSTLGADRHYRGADRRSEHRIPRKGRVEVYIASLSNVVIPVLASAVDVSSHGVGLLCNDHLAPGQRAWIRLGEQVKIGIVRNAQPAGCQWRVGVSLA